MNQMIKEGHSILILTNDRSSWVFKLGKSSETLIGPYKCITDKPDVKIKTDLLVIHDAREVPNDFPIDNIKFKYILILSDESGQAPPFFKGKTIELIDWDNINNIVFNNNGLMFRSMSDREGKISLMKWAPKQGTKEETKEVIELPVEMLKRILLGEENARLM